MLTLCLKKILVITAAGMLSQGSQQITEQSRILNTNQIISVNQMSAIQTISESEKTDFVNNLNVSHEFTQLIIVAAKGSKAKITMHHIDTSGKWQEILTTSGYIGKEGVGKASEGCTKTPAGIYNLSFAFGVNKNPGTSLPYTKIDNSYYWVDDVHSIYYNKFVTTKLVAPDWSSAERIADYPNAYAYVIAIDYNQDCVKGLGSAFFLHCTNDKPTQGCVTISKKDMLFILKHINNNCAIVIDKEANIQSY